MSYRDDDPRNPRFNPETGTRWNALDGDIGELRAIRDRYYGRNDTSNRRSNDDDDWKYSTRKNRR